MLLHFCFLQYCCGSVAVLLLHRASANNDKQQCCWLPMSIGSSRGTAVNSAAVVAAPIGLAVLACCNHRLLPGQLAVLPDGMVVGTICPGIRRYVGLERCSAIVCHFQGVCGSSCSSITLFFAPLPPMPLYDTACRTLNFTF